MIEEPWILGEKGGRGTIGVECPWDIGKGR